MHYFCRETCGLCRLPTGRPQLTFSWDGKPVNDSFGQAAAAASGKAQPAGGAAAHGARHRHAGRAEGFIANEWHAVHAVHAAGGEVVSSDEEGVAAQRTVLLVGAFGWSTLLVVSLAAAVRGLWHRRHSRHGASELPRRTRRPDGAAAAATFPLLR